jgi:hypothetical protein
LGGFFGVFFIANPGRQVCIGFSLPVHADIRDLRAALARDTGIEPGQLLLVEIDGLGFQRTFTDGEPLANVGAECPLYGIEMPRRPSLAGEPANSSEDGDGDGGGDGAFILLTWVNVFKEGTAIEARFGSPYTIQVPYRKHFTGTMLLYCKLP